MKNIKILFFVLLACSLTASTVMADGLSLQLKRTNPGIIKERPAELIFDIVNTDMTHQIEGFIWCRSPDDVIISSAMGAGSGTGAQYVSPKFYMDEGPSQKALSLVIESEVIGDMRTGCIIKYAPFSEKEIKETKETQEEKTITEEEIQIEGVSLRLVNQTNSTEKVLLVGEDEIAVEIDKQLEIGDAKATIISVNEGSVVLLVESTIEEEAGAEKTYLKMNGKEVSELKDSEYREIRLDKTVPFIDAPKNAEVNCPEGQTHCESDEVDISEKTRNYFLWIIGVLAILLMIFVGYIIGSKPKQNFQG